MNFCLIQNHRSKNYAKGDDYNNTWKANDDGKVNTNAPRRQVGTEGQGVATSGFINRYLIIFLRKYFSILWKRMRYGHYLYLTLKITFYKE